MSNLHLVIDQEGQRLTDVLRLKDMYVQVKMPPHQLLLRLIADLGFVAGEFHAEGTVMAGERIGDSEKHLREAAAIALALYEIVREDVR